MIVECEQKTVGGILVAPLLEITQAEIVIGVGIVMPQFDHRFEAINRGRGWNSYTAWPPAYSTASRSARHSSAYSQFL